MFQIVLSIHLALCIILIGFVLVQQGKGADAGAIMGGGTDSLLGAGAAGNTLTKLTTSLAIGFMITSILLVKAYNSRSYIAQGGERDILQGSVMEPVAKEAVVDEVSEQVEAGTEVAAPETKAVESQEAASDAGAKEKEESSVAVDTTATEATTNTEN